MSEEKRMPYKIIYHEEKRMLAKPNEPPTEFVGKLDDFEREIKWWGGTYIIYSKELCKEGNCGFRKLTRQEWEGFQK